MKTRLGLIFAGFVGVLVWFAMPSAQAQPSIVELNDEVVAAADAVVSGTILSTTDVEVNGMPHRVSRVRVSATLEGTPVAGEVLVEVPGGQRADGTGVFVSHTANLVEGADVQLALKIADPMMQSVLPVALELPAVAYSIVGGENGAVNVLPAGTAVASAGGGFANSGLSWPAFTAPLSFKVNPANSGLSATATINGVRAGFDNWENDPGSSINFNYAGTSSSSGINFGDDQVVVSWVNAPGASWLGQAWLEFDSTGRIFEFDIQLNRGFQWTNGLVSGRFHIPTVVGHEVGHGLGFDHVTAQSELLYGTIFSGSSKSLGAGDRDGARAIYPALASCDGFAVTVFIGQGQNPTNGRDVILGTAGSDNIQALGGNDVVCGAGGNDTINGGLGSDRLFGGTGNDDLIGGSDDDYLSGESGADLLRGGFGHDTLLGGTANDVLHGQDGDDLLNGGDQDDSLFGGNGADDLIGGSGDDLLQGLFGADLLRGGFGKDVLHGGAHDDVLHGQGGADVLNGQEGSDMLYGGGGADDIIGGSGHDLLKGQGGADLLRAGFGNDDLFGGAANDVLFGQDGNDLLSGGPGSDACTGGSGADVLQSCAS